jgi:superfamily I DNA/RNA helicase
MHNAKGLEFEEVFIVGLEEGLYRTARASPKGWRGWKRNAVCFTWRSPARWNA